MAANTDPIYSKTPDVSKDGTTGMSQLVTAAAADYTGISGNYALIHTAGSNGSYVRKIRCKAGGTNVAAVARIFLNNGSTNGTAANNAFYGEISLPVTTASTTAATPDIDYPVEIALPAGTRLYVGLGAAVAAGWVFTAIAGQY